MLTLPETLLLFALHDDRGTVHSIAFLALDHVLRAAVLAELKLRGHLQVRSTGEARRSPNAPPPPKVPFLKDAWDVLSTAKSPAPVGTWMDTLATGLPDLRARILTVLELRRILTSTEKVPASGRKGAVEATYPLWNRFAEQNVREEVVGALDAGEAIEPRHGILVALTVASHLDALVFGDRRDEADERAAWVSDRDAIVRAAVEHVAQAEGRW